MDHGRCPGDPQAHATTAERSEGEKKYGWVRGRSDAERFGHGVWTSIGRAPLHCFPSLSSVADTERLSRSGSSRPVSATHNCLERIEWLTCSELAALQREVGHDAPSCGTFSLQTARVISWTRTIALRTTRTEVFDNASPWRGVSLTNR